MLKYNEYKVKLEKIIVWSNHTNQLFDKSEIISIQKNIVKNKIITKKQENIVDNIYFSRKIDIWYMNEDRYDVCSGTGSNRGPSAHKTDALTN